MRNIFFFVLYLLNLPLSAQVLFTQSVNSVNPKERADSLRNGYGLTITYMGQLVNRPLGAAVTSTDSTKRIDSTNTGMGIRIKGEEGEDSLLISLGEDSLRSLSQSLAKKIKGYRTSSRMLSPDEMYRSVPSILPIYVRSWGEYRISSGFGLRVHPIKGTLQNHSGIDLPQSRFAPVLATADGIVDRIIWQPDGIGLAVYIKHESGYQTGYGHLTDHSVLVGQSVTRGQQIGRVGNTGGSTAPHLHYIVMAGSVPVDPAEFCFLLVRAIRFQQTLRAKVN